jgi:uncharacterized protein involved in type VI secretion and phage assembly
MTVPFVLSVDGVGPLRVHSLEGKEGISEAWRFDIVASGALEEEAGRLALGQRATLVFDLAEQQRAFHGVVSAIKVEEVHAIDRETKYVIRIVPRLWLLRRNKKTRIFQKRRVVDIVTSVLSDAGIAIRWALVRSYPHREYCTQYEETDYDFVRRLLLLLLRWGPRLEDRARREHWPRDWSERRGRARRVRDRLGGRGRGRQRGDSNQRDADPRGQRRLRR